MRILVLISLLAGCATEKPICVQPATANGKPKDTAGWYHLLVERALDGSAADCTGAAIAWKPAQGCVESDPPARLLPAAPFSDADLVFTRVDEQKRLAWAITQRYADG